MKARPLGNRVLLKRVEPKEEEMTQGILILPDSTKKKVESYEVVALGDGEMPIQLGDIVILDKYAGQPIDLDGFNYLIAKCEEIALVERLEK